jgi:tetratricopeptide (TPR) repeat protein
MAQRSTPVKPRLIALCLAIAAGALAQTKNLGRIDFPTSGSPEAQKHFVQGALLLHSFEYEDAREEFQAAGKAEPDFAMAYWGEALTYTHPVWVEQNVSAGRAALARLAPTPEARLAKAPTEREKDYLRTVEILYGEGDKVSRDQAYADAMGRLMTKYPNDLEAAALYAVALLGTCQYERQFPVYMRAAAVAEEVFAKNPQHPGAIHYLIHAYDDPIHAPLGLRPARVYGKIAGSASHAQHMPSHIFFALGMWNEAVAANEASVAVADERVKRKGLGPDQRNYHALLWLEYGYLQQGRNTDAQRVLADVERTAAQVHSGRLLSHLALMEAAYVTETGQVEDRTAAFDFTKAGLVPAVALFTAQALIAARSGHLEQARQLYSTARKQFDTTAGPAPESPHASMPMAHAGMDPIDRKIAALMIDQLHGELLFAEGKREEALNLIAETTAREDALTFEFGPPVPVKPAHELYGEMLLEVGRTKEARQEFERALARAPKRALSLRGLAKAGAAPENAATGPNPAGN